MFVFFVCFVFEWTKKKLFTSFSKNCILGGLFDNPENDTQAAFHYAVDHVNTQHDIETDFKLEAASIAIDYEAMSQFEVSKKLCRQFLRVIIY